jgi:hypothetical protein
MTTHSGNVLSNSENSCETQEKSCENQEKSCENQENSCETQTTLVKFGKSLVLTHQNIPAVPNTRAGLARSLSLSKT